MSNGLVVALALIAAAFAVARLTRPAGATGRWTWLLRRPVGTGPAGQRQPARASSRPAVDAARARLVALAVGLAAALGIGGWSGGLAGAVIAVAAYLLLTRRPNPATAAADRRADADLPFAADLIAAALRAGAAPDLAARSVGEAIGGPLGERLARVDQALRLGAPAEEAWAYLGDGPAARRLARAAVRSEHSGAELASALQRLADDLRTDWLAGAEAAARRAGVLIVLPLGLCFLPAFVLAGLVPVIVAVLGDVLSP